MISKVKCPNCGKLSEWNKDNSFRPFCSERCRLIDLGDWANESHRIPEEDPFAQHDSDIPTDDLS